MDNTPRFLSWGAGLQSTVIGEMSARGDLPRCTVIHADTGWERQATIEMRDFYAARWRGMGLEVRIIKPNPRGMGKTIKEPTEHTHPPFFVQSGGILGRRCTVEYKIKPIRRTIRTLLGFHPSKAPAPKPGAAIVWLGITVDEWTRAKPARVQYTVNRWPLLVLRMHRQDCTEWLVARDLPIPPKSACVCCPYRRPSEWIEMRNNAPDEWQAVIEFDKRNRCRPWAIREDHDDDALFIYRGAMPLVEADLESDAARERQYYGTQLPMFACESGFCDV